MRIVTLACAGIALLVLCVPASALSINPLLTTTATNDVEFLAGKLLAPTSNVTVLGTNQSFVGILGNNTTAVIPAQSGWYTGFNLVPSFGPNPAITNPDGILLTTGNAEIAQTNTSDAFSNIRGASGDSDLAALLGLATLDANSLEFDFTVASGYNAVAADFVFGTEEWSEFPDYPDIFAFFVDGVNYAFFPDNSLIKFSYGTNAAYFNDNEIADGSPYALEYDGITNSLRVVGLLDGELSTHHIKIVIGDANDNLLDSGVFIGNLFATNSEDGGGIDVDPIVPEPTSIALLGLGLAGLGLVARKRRRT